MSGTHMRILITGAAGNLGGFLARFLLDSPHQLRLMIHQTDVGSDLRAASNVEVIGLTLATRQAWEASARKSTV